MPRKILDFDGDLPSSIYLDTSVLISYMVADAKYHQPCSHFLDRLEQEGVSLFLSTLSLDEIWYGLLRASLLRDYSDHWLEVIRATPEVIQNYTAMLEKTTLTILSLDYLTILEVSVPTSLVALQVMDKYALLPRDAIHLTVCETARIEAIASTDLDFLRVGDIKLFTCNPKAFSKP